VPTIRETMTFDEMRAMLPQQLKVDHLAPLTVPLHALHAMGLRYGEEQFRAKGSCVATFAVAIGTDVLWLESKFGPASHRRLVYRFMREFLHVSGAHAYCFMSEVWVAAVDNLDDIDVLPSERPESERDEVLLVTSFGRQGDKYLSRYLITPSRHPGKLAWLGPRVEDDFGCACRHGLEPV